jgi:hypothetical protein
MTHEEQISESLKLLAPPRGRRKECRRDIEIALNYVESMSQAVQTHKAFGSKKGKADLRRYIKALRDVQTAYGRIHPAIKPWFSLSEMAYIVGQPTVIDREIGKAELFLAKPSPPPQPDAIRAKAAVQVAHSMLGWWGHKANVTRGGKWEKLAKVLAGGQAAVFEHMRIFKQNPEPPIIDKLKSSNLLAFALRPRSKPGTQQSRFDN